MKRVRAKCVPVAIKDQIRIFNKTELKVETAVVVAAVFFDVMIKNINILTVNKMILRKKIKPANFSYAIEW